MKRVVLLLLLLPALAIAQDGDKPKVAEAATDKSKYLQQLSDLRKAHAQLLAAQRNVNGAAVQYRDLVASEQDAQQKYEAAKKKLEEESGMAYNEATLELEAKPAAPKPAPAPGDAAAKPDLATHPPLPSELAQAPTPKPPTQEPPRPPQGKPPFPPGRPPK